MPGQRRGPRQGRRTGRDLLLLQRRGGNDEDLDYTVVSGPSQARSGRPRTSRSDYTPNCRPIGKDGFTIAHLQRRPARRLPAGHPVADTPGCARRRRRVPPLRPRQAARRQLPRPDTAASVPTRYRDQHAADQGPAVAGRHRLLELSAPSSPTPTLRAPTRHVPAHRRQRLEPIRHAGDHHRRGRRPRARLLGHVRTKPPTPSRPARLCMFLLPERGRRHGQHSPPTAGPAHGSSSANSGQITYTANAGYVRPRQRPVHRLRRPRRHRQRQLRATSTPRRSRPATRARSPRASGPAGRDDPAVLQQPAGDPQSYSADPAGPRARSATSTTRPASPTRPPRASSATTRSRCSASDVVGDSGRQRARSRIDPDFNRAAECQLLRPKRVATATPTATGLATICSDPDGDPIAFERQEPAGPRHVDAGRR